MAGHIGRRKFLATLGGGVAAWPLVAYAQQPTMPVVGLVTIRSADGSARNASEKAFDDAGVISLPAVKMAIRYILPACCARAASGHAAAPPSVAKNFRRLM